MSETRSVLFDLDGTLTDSRPGILRSTRFALQRLNEEKGGAHPIPEEDALDFMIGPPLRDTFATLVGPENVEALLGYYRERYAGIGLFENAVFDGVPEALAALHATGYRLFVATSKNEADARRIRELLHALDVVHRALTIDEDLWCGELAQQHLGTLVRFLVGRARAFQASVVRLS